MSSLELLPSRKRRVQASGVLRSALQVRHTPTVHYHTPRCHRSRSISRFAEVNRGGGMSWRWRTVETLRMLGESPLSARYVRNFWCWTVDMRWINSACIRLMHHASFTDHDPELPCTAQNSELRTQHALALSAVLLFAIDSRVFAQTPPDFYPDGDKGNLCYRRNDGQHLNTDGAVQDDVLYFTERSPLGISLATKSRVSFTWAKVDQDSATVDTLCRIDMDFEGGRYRSPIPAQQVGDLGHYNIGDLVAEENVPGYHRAYYHSVRDSIDVHFPHGSAGPRMSFVVRPGGDPANIKLKFTGQDSINVDLLGTLKLYLDQDSIAFPAAIAYQVNANGSTTALAWSVTYDHEDG